MSSVQGLGLDVDDCAKGCLCPESASRRLSFPSGSFLLLLPLLHHRHPCTCSSSLLAVSRAVRNPFPKVSPACPGRQTGSGRRADLFPQHEHGPGPRASEEAAAACPPSCSWTCLRASFAGLAIAGATSEGLGVRGTGSWWPCSLSQLVQHPAEGGLLQAETTGEALGPSRACSLSRMPGGEFRLCRAPPSPGPSRVLPALPSAVEQAWPRSSLSPPAAAVQLCCLPPPPREGC